MLLVGDAARALVPSLVRRPVWALRVVAASVGAARAVMALVRLGWGPLWRLAQRW